MKLVIDASKLRKSVRESLLAFLEEKGIEWQGELPELAAPVDIYEEAVFNILAAAAQEIPVGALGLKPEAEKEVKRRLTLNTPMFAAPYGATPRRGEVPVTCAGANTKHYWRTTDKKVRQWNVASELPLLECTRCKALIYGPYEDLPVHLKNEDDPAKGEFPLLEAKAQFIAPYGEQEFELRVYDEFGERVKSAPKKDQLSAKEVEEQLLHEWVKKSRGVILAFCPANQVDQATLLLTRPTANGTYYLEHMYQGAEAIERAREFLLNMPS